MAVKGRKPKSDGQAKNRNRPTHDWTLVAAVPFAGPWPVKLPQYRLGGRSWPARTKAWWKTVRTMPHCTLWSKSDWEFAVDTAMIAAEFHDGDLKAATELRFREKVLGTTEDFRRDLRIRYVDPAELQKMDGARAPSDNSAKVTSIDEYRDLYGEASGS